MDITNEQKSKLYKVGLVFLVILTLHLAVRTFGDFNGGHMRGGVTPNTISFTGHGEVNAVPDIASINFTVQVSQPTQTAASDQVNTKTKKLLEFFKSSGIADKDIKTDNYTSYPTYADSAPCYGAYPCMREQKIVGYAVSQSITVKVRKVDDASKVIDGINKIGVTNMSGPNLTIDNEDTLKIQARKLAINDAKEKASVLAKDLGVRLGKVASFNESGNYPVMYAMDSMKASGAVMAPVSAEIPKGENMISSDVTITYEIR